MKFKFKSISAHLAKKSIVSLGDCIFGQVKVGVSTLLAILKRSVSG